MTESTDTKHLRAVAEELTMVASEEARETLRSLLHAGADRIQALEGERDEALRECVKYAREAGEAKGKLETSELAGVVDGWRERAEAAEARALALERFARAYAVRREKGAMNTDQFEDAEFDAAWSAARALLPQQKEAEA